MKKRILIVEDDVNFVLALKWHLLEDNYRIKWCTNKKKTFFMFKYFKPDIIILDVHLNHDIPDYSASLEILRKIKKKNYVKVIISTVETDLKIREEFLKAGADVYLCKPYTYKDLKANIEK